MNQDVLLPPAPPPPACEDDSVGWLVVRNSLPESVHLRVWDSALGAGTVLTGAFELDALPPPLAGVSPVLSVPNIAAGQVVEEPLGPGSYTVIVTRAAGAGGGAVSEEWIVSADTDLFIDVCAMIPMTYFDTASYLAWDGPEPTDDQVVDYETFTSLVDQGKLIITNSELSDLQGAAVEQEAEESEAYVQAQLQDGNPKLLAFLNQPIEADATLQPTADGNWKMSFTNEVGDTQEVTNLGASSMFSSIADTLEVKGTLANEKATYLKVLNQIQALVPAMEWSNIKENLMLPPLVEIEAITDLQIIVDMQVQFLYQWESWIATTLEAILMAPPPNLPSCEDEVGSPPMGIPDAGTTDQLLNGCSHRNNGVFANYSYPLKWSATCVKDQAARGACASFAITSAVEANWAYHHEEWLNLSEQYLYWRATGEWYPRPWGDGLVMHGTAKHMIPVDDGGDIGYPFIYPFEYNWIYSPSHARQENQNAQTYMNSCVLYTHTPCSDTVHQARETCAMVTGASGQVWQCGHSADKAGDSDMTVEESVQIWDLLDDKQLSIGFSMVFLDLGIPLVMGVPVTPSFDSARKSGFIQYKGAEEKNRGYHFVNVLGYIRNADLTDEMDVLAEELSLESDHYNGGGYYIAKNSWGSCWKDGGYVYIPFSWATAYTGGLITIKAFKRP